MNAVIDSLRQQISTCENTLQNLRQQLAEAEHALRSNGSQSHELQKPHAEKHEIDASEKENTTDQPKWPLLPEEYKRYGRQLIMPEIGLQGQLQLRKSRVLIVGVGGLGCPAAAYLAGAGVGTLGLIDGDTVEVSNLHRQILHSTTKVGMTKVHSAMVALTDLNPNIKLIPHDERLTTKNSLSIFKHYDLVLDCTDTPASRYLISDTCVLLGKPLVSASALRIDGQLMVLNNPPLPPGDKSGGPCYRCVFPKPPPPESVVSCGDGGILGPVVGVMGVLQALEAIKVLTQKPSTSSSTPAEPPTLLIFSAYSNPMFRSIRLRSRKPKCATCSAEATITPEALQSGSLDYVQFCGSVGAVNALSQEERVSAQTYAELRSGQKSFQDKIHNSDDHILVDVREKVQYDLCNIDRSINLPFSLVSATRKPEPGLNSPESGSPNDSDEKENWVRQLEQSEKPIFVVCRLGNDSQLVVKKMKDFGLDREGKRFIGDITGGLSAWRKHVDSDFPDY